MQQLQVNCFGFRVSSVLLFRSKKYVGNEYTPSIQKVRNAVKVFLLLSMLVMCKYRFCNALYCTTNHFCALVNDNTVVVMIKCFVPPQCWSCAKPNL